MNLSYEAIQEFKKIWKEEFNEEISDEYARERAESLMRLVKIVLDPLPGEIPRPLKMKCQCQPYSASVSRFHKQEVPLSPEGC